MTDEQAKGFGMTHKAVHRKKGKYHKAGDVVYVTYNKVTGEYKCGPLTCLLNPHENYVITEL